jgi:hypothetical protein
MATSALIQTHVFGKIYIFPPTVVASVKELCPCCAGQLHSLD